MSSVSLLLLVKCFNHLRVYFGISGSWIKTDKFIPSLSTKMHLSRQYSLSILKHTHVYTTTATTTHVVNQFFGPWWIQVSATSSAWRQGEFTLPVHCQDSHHQLAKPQRKDHLFKENCFTSTNKIPKTNAYKCLFFLRSSKSFFNTLQGSNTSKPQYIFKYYPACHIAQRVQCTGKISLHHRV